MTTLDSLHRKAKRVDKAIDAALDRIDDGLTTIEIAALRAQHAADRRKIAALVAALEECADQLEQAAHMTGGFTSADCAAIAEHARAALALAKGK